MPETRHVLLCLSRDDTIAAAIQNKESCGRIVPDTADSLIDDVQKRDHLTHILKPRVPQNVGQPKSFEPFAPDAGALTSEFEENSDDRKHTLDQR